MLVFLPSSIAHNQTLQDWGIDAIFAVILSALATFTVSRFGQVLGSGVSVFESGVSFMAVV